MNIMHGSSLLSVSSEGPISAASGDLIHLRQGDLDGACGPYCLFSALITLGLLERDDVLQSMSFWKGSSRNGRLRDALKKFGVLNGDGTYGWDLVELTQFYKRKGLAAVHLEVSRDGGVSKRQLLQKVCDAIDSGALPIIGVEWAGGAGHWLLVVGYQGVEKADDIQFTHLLCLDPGEATPKTSLWNAVIEVQDGDGASVSLGRLSSNHWSLLGEVSKCQVKDAVILSLSGASRKS
ncbi:hypothetical protein [Ectopseudomonas mendocina]|uniref:hypothetical protein n=1 Tax=Ectopseudomonas mendocina TaxID=300 RepID=UPI000206E09C|nr:hypothetical protein [Pseudomonas mendocina]AEB59844.1 hypothetical protein MDS_3813 [Pseudomonas mendocina NK-01]